MKGHKESINSFSALDDGSTHLLASASDDGTVRVWDCAGSPRAVRCLDVSSRVPISEVAWSGAHCLALTADTALHIVDLRQHGDTIVIKTPQHSTDLGQELHTISCISSTTHNATATAVGADDGTVTFFPPLSTLTTLRPTASIKPHENVVSGVAHCSHNPALIWSVGMDCTLSLCDVSSEASFQTIELPQVELEKEGTARVINPPLPTCLTACSQTGKVGVGIMDGTVWVFDTDLDVEAMWPVQSDVPIEAVVWGKKVDELWVAAKSGYVALYKMLEPVEEGEEGEEEEEEGEGGDAAELLTALQCPEPVTALCCPKWLGEYQVITGDVSGDIAVHTLPQIGEL